jgi:diguanylate cyclase (GGDEF)-like protein
MENAMSDINRRVNEILMKAKSITVNHPQQAYEMSKEAYDLSKCNNLTLEKGYSLIGMSLACRAKSDISLMLDHAYKALELFEELQVPDGQARAMNLIGIAYFYNSEYEQALGYLMKAQNILEAHEDIYLLSCVFNNIAEVMRESKKYEESLDYYCRALRLSSELNSNVNIASILGNIGEVYFIQNKKKEALEYFTQSYHILINESDSILLAELENKLGKLYFYNENINEAEKYFFSALNRLEGIDNKFYEIDVLLSIAQLKYENDKNAALYYLERALQCAEGLNAKKKLSSVYKAMSEYYERTCEFKEALIFYKRYHNIENEISVSNLGNKFEALKFELDHYHDKHNYQETQMINTRLEMEIFRQKNELEKIQKLNKILEEKAYHDELTGIPNRRYLNNQLQKMWENPEFKGQVITLFMIDIDNFKKFNDCFGHIEGDKCLQRVADCLSTQLSQNDVFGRYGGEEFLYFSLNRSYEEAHELGNRLRYEIEKMSLGYTMNEEKSILTISIGGVWGKLSEFNNIYEIVQYADRELYHAKDSGRNTVIIYRFQ